MPPHVYAVLDLDDVVYDFPRALIDFAARRNRVHRSTFSAPTTWKFHEEWGWSSEEFWEMVSAGVLEGEIYWEGTPLPASLEGWNRVREVADTIHVVTARTPYGAMREAAEATVFWLRRNGFLYDELSITTDKVAQVQASAPEGADIWTIDDSPSNYEKYKAAGFQSVLFSQPTNTHVDTPNRVTDLATFARMIAAGPENPAN